MLKARPSLVLDGAAYYSGRMADGNGTYVTIVFFMAGTDTKKRTVMSDIWTRHPEILHSVPLQSYGRDICHGHRGYYVAS